MQSVRLVAMNKPEQSTTTVGGVVYPPSFPTDGGNLDGKILQLATILQSSLDVARVMEVFAEELASVVPHESLHYENVLAQVRVTLGTPGAHRCQYQLVLLEKGLGEIAVTRRTPFTEAELKS